MSLLPDIELSVEFSLWNSGRRGLQNPNTQAQHPHVTFKRSRQGHPQCRQCSRGAPTGQGQYVLPIVLLKFDLRQDFEIARDSTCCINYGRRQMVHELLWRVGNSRDWFKQRQRTAVIRQPHRPAYLGDDFPFLGQSDAWAWCSRFMWVDVSSSSAAGLHMMHQMRRCFVPIHRRPSNPSFPRQIPKVKGSVSRIYATPDVPILLNGIPHKELLGRP